mgnify:CR=1 FL=1
MAEQDEPLRHPHAAGELDEVALPVLHDSGADHAGVPGPLDKHVGDDDVLHIDAQQAHHGKHHDLAGEGEHHIHHPHDDLLHHTPEIAGHDAQRRPQCNRAQHGQQGQAQGRPDAINQPGEDAPAGDQCPGGTPAVRCEFVEDGRWRRGHGVPAPGPAVPSGDEQHHRHSDDRSAVM